MKPISPIPAEAEQIVVKERPISKRMQQVLTNLATKGVSQREAAKLAGMSESHLSRELKKPQIQVFIARRMREIIAIGGLRASARLIELIDAESEHVSADVSKHIAAIAGIKPSADAQVSVNMNITAGYVVDISPEPGARTVHTVPTHKVIDAV
jgi:lambda repressor-like predicted transcriptional regulator